MKGLLIPVKDLTSAKQRLAPCLSQSQRAALAETMMTDVFAAAASARGIDRIYVVSSYSPALEIVRSLGWELIREEEQICESYSVDLASRICEQQGITALLRLPIDIPLVQSGDIESLLAEGNQHPATVIVPSRDGAGTNAILRAPPTLFRSHFGPGSLSKHMAEAARKNVPCKILPNPRIALDIDDEDDLRVFLESGSNQTETARCLQKLGCSFNQRATRTTFPGPALAEEAGD